MSLSILSPVIKDSEPTALAHCHSKERTNERHSLPKKQPIPWPQSTKRGLVYIGPMPLSPRTRPAWWR